jgi:hypothetical protein
MRKTVLGGCFVLAAVIAAQAALAQIAITRNTIEDFFNSEFHVVSSVSTDEDRIIELLDAKGADQVWDFTGMEMEYTLAGDGRVQFFSSSEGTLGEEFEHFDQATHVIRGDFIITETYEGDVYEIVFANYEYSILSDEEYTVLGVVVTEFLDPEEREIDGLIFKRPGQLQYKFPVTYGSAWETEYEEQSIFFGFDNTFDYTEEVVVDGWGELVTPHGTFEVLRISRLRTMDLGFVGMESLEVEFVNVNGMPLATIEVDIEFGTGEFDTEYAEATLNLIITETSAPQEAGMELPVRATLHQNYPNPFNPTTQISYDLAEASAVSLDIYSLTGTRVLSVLDNSHQSAGTHTVMVDASQLASGVYIYQLRAGGQVFTRRMTLVR